MMHKITALLLFFAIAMPCTSLAQSEAEASLPPQFWELMGICIESEKFDFLREHFPEAHEDPYGNIVFTEADYAVEFFFRPKTRHLNQIRVDLDYYDGPAILGLKKGMSKRAVKKLRKPKQVLNYGTGSYFIGDDYSILAAFEGWPFRKLVRFTVIYEGEYYPDADMDGVPDSVDMCPDEVGPEDYLGCPSAKGVPQVEEAGLVDELCRVIDSVFRYRSSIRQLGHSPFNGDIKPVELYTPHMIYKTLLDVHRFERVFMVESFSETDTSGMVYLVSFPFSSLETAHDSLASISGNWSHCLDSGKWEHVRVEYGFTLYSLLTPPAKSGGLKVNIYVEDPRSGEDYYIIAAISRINQQ